MFISSHAHYDEARANLLAIDQVLRQIRLAQASARGYHRLGQFDDENMYSVAPLQDALDQLYHDRQLLEAALRRWEARQAYDREAPAMMGGAS